MKIHRSTPASDPCFLRVLGVSVGAAIGVASVKMGSALSVLVTSDNGCSSGVLLMFGSSGVSISRLKDFSCASKASRSCCSESPAGSVLDSVVVSDGSAVFAGATVLASGLTSLVGCLAGSRSRTIAACWAGMTSVGVDSVIVGSAGAEVTETAAGSTS